MTLQRPSCFELLCFPGAADVAGQGVAGGGAGAADGDHAGVGVACLQLDLDVAPPAGLAVQPLVAGLADAQVI